MPSSDGPLLRSSAHPSHYIINSFNFAGFIVKCLNSSNHVVRSVAKHGVYFQRMHSPVGRNAQYRASVSVISIELQKLTKRVSSVVSALLNSRIFAQNFEAHRLSFQVYFLKLFIYI